MLLRDATDEQRRNQDKWDWGAGRKLRDLAKSRGLSAKQFTRDILLSLKD